MKKDSFPRVNSNDILMCKFGSSVSPATITEEQKSVVTCMAPVLSKITSTPKNPGELLSAETHLLHFGLREHVSMETSLHHVL